MADADRATLAAVVGDDPAAVARAIVYLVLLDTIEVGPDPALREHAHAEACARGWRPAADEAVRRRLDRLRFRAEVYATLAVAAPPRLAAIGPDGA